METRMKIPGDLEGAELEKALKNPADLDVLIASHRKQLRSQSSARKLTTVICIAGIVLMAIINLLTSGVHKRKQIGEAKSPIEAVQILEGRLDAQRSRSFTFLCLGTLAVIGIVNQIQFGIHRTLLDSRLNTLLLFRELQSGDGKSSDSPDGPESE